MYEISFEMLELQQVSVRLALAIFVATGIYQYMVRYTHRGGGGDGGREGVGDALFPPNRSPSLGTHLSDGKTPRTP